MKNSIAVENTSYKVKKSIRSEESVNKYYKFLYYSKKESLSFKQRYNRNRRKVQGR